MNTPQRLLLVLFLLVAGGALAGALLMGGKDGPGGPRGVERTAGPAADRTPSPQTDLLGQGQPGRMSAAGEPAGSLEVRVLDESGAKLPGEVRLIAPGGEELTATGSTTWEALPVGEWDLRARHDGLIAYRASLTITDGEHTRVTAQLLPALPVRGRVVDRFGQGVGTTNVWFIRRDQTFPADTTAARKVQTCLSDSRGVFKAELDRKGLIRVAAGKPGRKLVESEPIDFSSSGPQELTIVIEGTGSLELELENPPTALAEGKANLVVTVLAERKERGDGPRRRRSPGSGARKGKGKEADADQARDLRGGRDTKREGSGAAGERSQDEQALRDLGYASEEVAEPPEETQETGRTGPAAGQDAPSEPRLSTLAERRFPPEGRLSFDALPPDRELVIQLTRRLDLFRSQPIRLSPNRASIVRVRVPARRSDEERAAQPYGELTVMVSQRPLPADAPPVGVTWE